MKSFKTIISEVAQPKPEEEKRFKDQHSVEVAPHPVASEIQHKGVVKPKAKRKADQEGDANYDKAYMESVEELDEISRELAGSYIRKASAAEPDRYTKKSGKTRASGIELAGKKAYGIGGKAKVNATESVEELDEISRDTARSYIRKAAADNADRKDKVMKPFPIKDMEKNVAMHKKMKSREKGIELAGKKAYGIGGKAKVNATEEVELEENITKMSHGRLKFHLDSNVPHGSYTKAEMKAERDRRLKTGEGEAYKKAKAGLSEAEQIDELSKKTLGSYIKKAKTDVAGKAYQLGAKDPLKPKASWSKTMSREKNIDKAVDRLTKEEVEQLDELSPNTLHSYIKKAAGNMAGNAAVAAAQASSSMKKSSPDVKRKIKNRMQGITGASGRLADKANMAENWQEEIPMMMRQLEFISYAAEEIMDYLDMAGDPEEWFQNKLAGIHQSMLSMYAYAQGGRRAGYGFDESVELEEKLEKETIKHPVGQRPKGAGWVLKKAGEQTGKDHSVWERKFKRVVPSTTKEEVDLEEELKGGQKKLDHNKNGKLDAHDFKLMRAKKMKEEVEELDEISQEKLRDYHAKAGADRQKAKAEVEKGMAAKKFTPASVQKTTDAYKRFTKRGKGMTAAANKMSEEVEILDEAFKQGIVKLKDGSSVALKKEDADLLNQMFKDLSAANRKKMQEVAMKDKAGFEEILGFAREAL